MQINFLSNIKYYCCINYAYLDWIFFYEKIFFKNLKIYLFLQGTNNFKSLKYKI